MLTDETAQQSAPLKEVKRGQPCPICGKTDWCRRSADGAIACKRINMDKVDGYRRIKECPEETIYRPVDNRAQHGGRDHKRTSRQDRKPHEYDTPDKAADSSAKYKHLMVVNSWEWSNSWTRYRLEDEHGEKSFVEVTHNGSGWVCKGPKKPHTLFQVDKLPETGTVYVVEGEKCVEAARSIGLAATTSGSCKSAGGADWSPLAGREVVILPDNDQPGQMYAADVVQHLHTLEPPATVRVVELPDLGEKEDIADFCSDHRDGQAADDIRAEIEALVAESPVKDREVSKPAGTPALLKLSDVQEREIEWLWEGRIAYGTLTGLYGPPGIGKSFLIADLVAKITSGKSLLFDHRTLEPHNVVLAALEDDPSRVLVPRLKRAGGDVGRVTLLRGVYSDDGTVRHLNLAENVSIVADAICATGSRIAVIDPLGSYMGKADGHRHSDVYNVLAPLAAVAEKANCAVILCNHTNKTKSPDAHGRAMGSIGFIGAMRNTWFVASEPDSADGAKLLLHGKANLGPPQPGCRFWINQPGVVVWDPSPIHQSADQVFQAEADKAGGKKANTEITRAEDFVRQTLKDGPMPSKDLEAGAAAAGISKATLKRARTSLGVACSPLKGPDGQHLGWEVRLDEENQ